jgi:hypothetical protein
MGAGPRLIQAQLDGASWADTRVGGPGHYTIAGTLPSNLGDGAHTLRVAVQPSIRATGASVSAVVNSMRLAPQLSLTTSQFWIVPWGLSVQTHMSVPREARGKLTVTTAAGTTFMRPDHRGATTGTLSSGWSPLMAGPQDVVLTYRSDVPWMASRTISTHPIAINLPDLVVLLIVLGVVLAGLPRALPALRSVVERRRPGVQERAESRLPEKAAPRLDLPAPVTASSLPAGLKNSSDPIVRTYCATAELVGERVGIALTQEATLREYRQAVAGHLDGAVDAFSQITDLAEQALYSADNPGAPGAALAAGLYHEVKRKLWAHSGE